MGPTKSEVERKKLQRLLFRGISIPAAVAAYAFTLHWVYLNLITEQFEYAGYTYIAPDAESSVYMFLAATVTAYLLPSRVNRASALVLWVLFVVAVAPSIFVPTYTGYLDHGQAMISGLAIAACYSLAALVTKRRQPVKPLRLQMRPSTFWFLIGLVSLGIYTLVAVTLGLRLQFVSLLDVYDVRDEYKTGLAGASGIVGYLVSTQANVINPLIITRGIYSKRWGLVLIGALGQAILFSGTGFKTILFSLPAMVIFALVFRVNLQPRPVWLLCGATIMAFTAAIIDSIQGGLTLTSLFARRFLLTPGLLMSAYMAYYNENEFAYLSHSILEPWIPKQYQFAPARMIGMWITGSSASAYNANIFADGYANFGYAGMAGAAVVLGLYLRILDRASHGLPVAISGLVLIMPAIALSNTSVLTAMFSHGLAVAVLILALAPREGWGRKPGRKARDLARLSAEETQRERSSRYTARTHSTRQRNYPQPSDNSPRGRRRSAQAVRMAPRV